MGNRCVTAVKCPDPGCWDEPYNQTTLAFAFGVSLLKNIAVAAGILGGASSLVGLETTSAVWRETRRLTAVGISS